MTFIDFFWISACAQITMAIVSMICVSLIAFSNKNMKAKRRVFIALLISLILILVLEMLMTPTQLLIFKARIIDCVIPKVFLMILIILVVFKLKTYK